MNTTEANDTTRILRVLLGQQPADDRTHAALVRLAERTRKTLHAGVRESEIPAVLPDPRAELARLRDGIRATVIAVQSDGLSLAAACTRLQELAEGQRG